MDLAINDFSDDLHLAFQELEESIKKFDKVHYHQAKFYYAASLIEPKFAETFRKASESDDFWDDSIDSIFEDCDNLYYLVKMDIPNKELVDKAIVYHLTGYQMLDGQLLQVHEEGLRTLVAHDIYSSNTLLALDYFIEDIDNFVERGSIYRSDIASGMLALMELDFEKYEKKISFLGDFLLSLSLELSSYYVSQICPYVIALSRFLGQNSHDVVSACNLIREKRPADGWNSGSGSGRLTPDICIALVEAGFGPKVSKSFHDWEIEKLNQLNLKAAPTFIHTSPIFEEKIHIKQIYDRIIVMLRRAEKEILISSLYVDMLYEDLINMANKEISIKLLVRPPGDAKGLRQHINKNVLSLLKMATKGNVKTCKVCHTRMIIVDSKEVLISTADLTRDQLYDEFNAGIWSEHPDTVHAAIKFFENIWKSDISEKLN